MSVIDLPITKETKMTQKIAEKDLTRRNALGQNVVVVPKGQPIPEGFDSASTGLRSTEASTTAVSDGTTVTEPPQVDPAANVPAEPEAKPKRGRGKKAD